ncbi:deacylase [Vineibacter terrae]|uniref:Deacylase n=1 Tax=Vineibacter terrae TaxID=2586908 RepID=A0A5C8PRG7_9HYPH|nr:succinylglutamate desuccinylase/aspartoacylase family protein [Vineibacter terrae]TXL77621.1 deacylase [Vineibacter terrae]
MKAAERSRLFLELDLARNGKQTGFIRVPHSVHRSAYGWLPIPVACIKNGDGPRVLMMAGNHGDEWEGQLALGGLIRDLEPAQVRGRLIILPSANFPAAQAGLRTSPIDDGNLNRSFPGDPDGDVTRQIAYFIEHVLLPQCDYAFDFHSGGSSLMYIPSTLCRRDPDLAAMARLLGMMKAFGAPLGWVGSALQGQDRTLTAAARRQGVASMGTELGGGGQVTPSVLKLAAEGMRRLLAHIGAYVGPVPATPDTRLLTLGGNDYYVYAPDGGVFEPLAELGDEVKRGQPAGRIHFHDTPWRTPALAHFAHDGLVICKRVPGRTERGDCLYHLGSAYPG